MKNLIYICITISYIFFYTADSFCGGTDLTFGQQMLESKRKIYDTIMMLRLDFDEKIYTAFQQLDPELKNDLIFKFKLFGLRPTFKNERLDKMAQNVCEYVINEGISLYSSEIKEIITKRLDIPDDNIHIDTSGLIFNEFISPDDASRLILNNLGPNLLKGLVESDTLSFFDRDLSQIGIGFCSGNMSLDSHEKFNIYLLIVVETPTTLKPGENIQCGHIFIDQNQNGKYDIGEGIQAIIKNEDGKIITKTTKYGGYCLRSTGYRRLFINDLRAINSIILFSSHQQEEYRLINYGMTGKYFISSL